MFRRPDPFRQPTISPVPKQYTNPEPVPTKPPPHLYEPTSPTSYSAYDEPSSHNGSQKKKGSSGSLVLSQPSQRPDIFGSAAAPTKPPKKFLPYGYDSTKKSPYPYEKPKKSVYSKEKSPYKFVKPPPTLLEPFAASTPASLLFNDYQVASGYNNNNNNYGPSTERLRPSDYFTDRQKQGSGGRPLVVRPEPLPPPSDFPDFFQSTVRKSAIANIGAPGRKTEGKTKSSQVLFRPVKELYNSVRRQEYESFKTARYIKTNAQMLDVVG